MDKYIKIGDFAKLCGTTVDTLLHYDRMGLLKPALTRSNRYRYYVPSQIQRFVSIRAMTTGRFSLADTAELLDARDLQRMEEAIEEGVVALREEIASMRLALACLNELAAQAHDAAVERDSEPRLVDLPEQYCIDLGVHMHATTVDYSESLEVLEAESAILKRLLEISPAAALSPYGQTATGPVEDGPVMFDNMFFLVRDERVARRFPGVITIPAGRHARIDGVCPWDETGSLHRRLVDYAASIGGDPCAPRYEYSAFRLFDSTSTDGFGDYRCTVIMPV